MTPKTIAELRRLYEACPRLNGRPIYSHELAFAAVNALPEILAEHPADDADEVTEDWLRSVGFTKTEVHGMGLTWTYFRCGQLEWCTSPDQWCVGHYVLPHPKTRGDVRRLAAALGVPLT